MMLRKLFILLLAASAIPAARAASAISRHKPRLVVNIVVGQMRYD